MKIDDEVARAASALDTLDPTTARVDDPRALRRIGLALRDIANAEAELDSAVAAAREEGYSWAAIGMVLGTTRQAAHSRFGTPARH